MTNFINHDDYDSFDDTVEFNDQVKSQYEDFKFFKTFSLLYFILFSRGTEIFMSYDVIGYDTMLCHFMSCDAIWNHFDVTSCHVMSCNIIYCVVMLCDVMRSHFI